MDDPHDQQRKDYISSFFPQELTGVDPVPDGRAGHLHQPMFTAPSIIPQNTSFNSSRAPSVNMELLESIMAMQGVEAQQAVTQQSAYSPQMLLEQQFKLNQLQQLQQLQNQIFQQQIALISGNTAGNTTESSSDIVRDRSQYHGLPTPGSSTEMRPQQTNEYVSPMLLQYMESSDNYRNDSMDMTPLTHAHNVYPHSQGSTSAPPSVFNNTSPAMSLPSAADLDFDISPLTSPWLGAHQQSATPSRHPQLNKRTASPSGDDLAANQARKKQSPAIRPVNPFATKKPARASKSASSTPLLRSVRSRRGSTAAGDTPSPVDLAMPPPAPPLAGSASSSSVSSSSVIVTPSSPAFNPHHAPATPASIMKLGRLGISSSLAPMPEDSVAGKAKAPARTKTTTETASRPKAKKPSSIGQSPSLKPILPGRLVVGISEASLTSLSAGSLSTGVEILGSGQQPRKTSHKAAEQKRRDALKEAYDELRILIPPVPLPSDENFPDEPVLPGALPPRGPPKAGAEGPNRGVSKLQLLLCGNDHIRQLKSRVERRDEEIGKLRREVMRLRGLVAGTTGGEDIDLERDLDAVECALRYGRDGLIEEDDEAEEE